MKFRIKEYHKGKVFNQTFIGPIQHSWCNGRNKKNIFLSLKEFVGIVRVVGEKEYISFSLEPPGII